MSIINHYKAVNDLIHNEPELEDYDAPVKIEVEGQEYTVTGVQLETNPETNEQVVWLKTVQE
jgi:hypothetical protein